jgi:hypothetical protein
MRATLCALVILAALPASAEPLPADAGAIDVRSYGAAGDGTDLSICPTAPIWCPIHC